MNTKSVIQGYGKELKRGTGRLARSLTFGEAVSIGIGAMIGGGIFAVIGIIVGIAGIFAPVSLILCTLIALFTGYSYAYLSRKYPLCGASYTYVKEIFGELAGGLTGWISWFACVSACAMYAVAFGYYMSYFVRVPWEIWGALLIILLVIVNILGAKAMGRFESILVALKVGILLLFIGAGILLAWGRVKEAFAGLSVKGIMSSTTPILIAASIIFIAYEGFEAIATSSEEVKDPNVVSKAIFTSIIVVASIYLLVTIISIGVSGIGKFSESNAPLAFAARNFLGNIGEVLLWLGGIFATSSAYNACLYSGSRILYAMARDGLAPSTFASVNERTNVPYMSILVTALLSGIVFVAVGALASTSLLASLLFMFLFLIVNISATKSCIQSRNGKGKIMTGTAAVFIAFLFAIVFLQQTISNIALGMTAAVLLLSALLSYKFSAKLINDAEIPIKIGEEIYK